MLHIIFYTSFFTSILIYSKKLQKFSLRTVILKTIPILLAVLNIELCIYLNMGIVTIMILILDLIIFIKDGLLHFLGYYESK